jgi:hypothetical protein
MPKFKEHIKNAQEHISEHLGDSKTSLGRAFASSEQKLEFCYENIRELGLNPCDRYGKVLSLQELKANNIKVDLSNDFFDHAIVECLDSFRAKGVYVDKYFEHAKVANPKIYAYPGYIESSIEADTYTNEAEIMHTEL